MDNSYKEILPQKQLSLLKEEFSRLKNSCYLDHAGATLYSKSQLEACMGELQSNLFSNPHSRNPSSSVTTDAVDFVRQRILAHFNTTEEEYSVIFTSGATAGIKLIAESFEYNGGLLLYSEENHTSIVGMREYILKEQNEITDSNDSSQNQEKVHCISKAALDKIMNQNEEEKESLKKDQKEGVNDDVQRKCSTNSGEAPAIGNYDQEFQFQESGDNLSCNSMKRNALVAFPAQCNFSGLKYPLEWISSIQKGRLEQINQIESFYFDEEACNFMKNSKDSKKCSFSPNVEESNHNWFVLLDAASFVATSRLDLAFFKPDFVPISFYKMFGYPTGLGALLVRNESSWVLKKKYFGGGTVNISLPSGPFHVKRDRLHERFEDGTIPFLSILAVKHGLDSLMKLSGPKIEIITKRTFRLAQYFYRNLISLKYPSGDRPVARIYSDTLFNSEADQGPIVTFNLLRNDGSVIGYSEMEQIAYLHDVHLRYGCFCNPGACKRHLDLTSEQVLKHYEAGHVCGDMRDIIDGQPTGAIRVSFGYMSSQQNADFLIQLIRKCWIIPCLKDQREILSSGSIQQNKDKKGVGERRYESMGLTRIFLYPIKSCGPFEVKLNWNLGQHGLLYDREWLITNSNGVPLTTKREPRLCQIKPEIDLNKNVLTLRLDGAYEAINLALEEGNNNKTIKTELCSSKVCGETILGYDCGEEVSKWLELVLDRPGLRLIRKCSDFKRKPRNSLDEISFSNQSQFLLLSTQSLRGLARELISKGVASSLVSFEEESTSWGGGRGGYSGFKAQENILKQNDHHQSNSINIDNPPNSKWDGSISVDVANKQPGGIETGGFEHGQSKQSTKAPLWIHHNQTNCSEHEEDDTKEGLIESVVESLIGRFRPNLVIDSFCKSTSKENESTIFEEESWKGIKIGCSLFKSGGACIRCATICMDPETGSKSSEPLLTLSEMREGRPNFGIHLYYDKDEPFGPEVEGLRLSNGTNSNGNSNPSSWSKCSTKRGIDQNQTHFIAIGDIVQIQLPVVGVTKETNGQVGFDQFQRLQVNNGERMSTFSSIEERSKLNNNNEMMDKKAKSFQVKDGQEIKATFTFKSKLFIDNID